jgi:excisionase family DNA binding protein
MSQHKRLAYSVAETALLLGAGRSTLWRWISKGHLKVRRVSGRTLVPAREIRRLAGGSR